MSFPQAPGVYYQTVDYGDETVAPLRADIAGFVGIASKGPVDTAIPIESWRQFATWFGGLCPAGYLGYAVRAFFENGGRRCWIVRIASNDPVNGYAYAATDDGLFDGIWRVRASSPGVWADSISFKLDERNTGQTSVVSSDPNGQFTTVASVSGFQRGSLVRIVPASGAAEWRVVYDIDASSRRILWVNPDLNKRKAYEAPLSVDAGFLQTVEYDLTLFDGGRLIRLYEGLSLVPDQARYGPSVLREVTLKTDSITGRTIATPPEPIVIEAVSSAETIVGIGADLSSTIKLSGGRDGLSLLTVNDFIGESPSMGDSVEAARLKNRGLRVLEQVSEVGILAAPDASVRATVPNDTFSPPLCTPDLCVQEPPPAEAPKVVIATETAPTFDENAVYRIQSEMIDQCERLRDRFAVMDAPYETVSNSIGGLSPIMEWRSRFDSKFAALYFPWIKVLDPLGTATAVNRTIPPCGHVAGGYAKWDAEIGIHKAPANQAVTWAVGLSTEVNDTQHGLLNTLGINVIKQVPGRSIRVMGARTVSSDTSWRYVNIRRLMSMIEKALEISLQWAVFEPNNTLTRLRATMSVSLFLSSLQEAGAFAGATSAESFYVNCNPDNNPADARDRGQLIIEIGIAPAKPFEFVLLRVGRVSESIEVTESATSFGFAAVEA